MAEERTRDERLRDLYVHFDPIDLAAWLVDAEDDVIRYRLAWLSARRRAADEANFGVEALERERARQASYVAELQPLIRGRMDEVRRLRAFADEVRHILGWTHVDGNWMTHHSPALHEARHELDEAQRENRPFRARLERQALCGDFDDVPKNDSRTASHPPTITT